MPIKFMCCNPLGLAGDPIAQRTSSSSLICIRESFLLFGYEMARGKPFAKRLTRMAVRSGRSQGLELTPPQFEPVRRTRPDRLQYPEDDLRRKFLSRNPRAQRIPVNLMAAKITDRHISDRFVALQLRLMNNAEDPLGEDDAYVKADRIMRTEYLHKLEETGEHASTSDTEQHDDFGSLIDPEINDEQVQLYLASMRDSKRDSKLHRAFVKEGEAAL